MKLHSQEPDKHVPKMQQAGRIRMGEEKRLNLRVILSRIKSQRGGSEVAPEERFAGSRNSLDREFHKIGA
jgi:hypothetical protein